MRIPIAVLFALVITIPATAQAAVSGTWKGVLNFPQGTLHFVLHVSGTNDTLSATADSPDQNAYDMPVDSIAFSGQTLHFTMAKLEVDFKGKVSGANISGTFVQHGVSAPLTLNKGDAGSPPSNSANVPPNGVVGTWKEVLNFPQGTLHFVLHVSGTNDTLSATADSPDQNAYGMPVDSITLSGQTLHFAMAKLDADFKGKLYDTGISGTFVQHGASVTLALVRSK